VEGGVVGDGFPKERKGDPYPPTNVEVARKVESAGIESMEVVAEMLVVCST